MAWPTSNFPTALDKITDVSDIVDNIVADNINGAYDCIEKIEAKVGINGSAVTSSLDYQLRNAASVNPGHKHTLLNSATDVTATAAELNMLDGSIAGTAVASKALVLGPYKNVNTLVVADGGLKLGSSAGTAVTATAAEIKEDYGSVAGTAVASKALVLGPYKNVDTLVVANGGLRLGPSAGTAVTATAAEINAACDGSTAKNNHTHPQVIAPVATIFSGTVTSPGVFQDLSVASIVGANVALCFLEIQATMYGSSMIVIKPKGYGDGQVTTHVGITIQQAGGFAYTTVMTNTSGVFSLGSTSNTVIYIIKLLGYIKSQG
jgi:hypothetical protein